MSILLVIAGALLLTPLHLRGGTLHNYVVNRVADMFRRAGFGVFCEHPIRLDDGRLDFVDLLVQCGTWEFCVEVETSARRALTNAAKADAAGLPLWVVVPNKKVQRVVGRKLEKAAFRPGGLKICIPLSGELEQTLTNCFPLFSSANVPVENRKTNKEEASIP